MSSDFTSAAPIEPARAPVRPPSIVHTIFLGPNGIRAGWRLLLFLAFFLGISFLTNKGLEHVPAFATWAKSQPKGTITAVFGIVRFFR